MAVQVNAGQTENSTARISVFGTTGSFVKNTNNGLTQRKGRTFHKTDLSARK